MPRLVILGTASAVSDESHENTHMALVGSQETVLIDCAGSALVRLKKVGVGLETISDIVLTHFHPDHVSAVPLLLMNLWLQGRQAALRVHGLGHCLGRLQTMMDLYEWQRWPGFYPVDYREAPEEENTTLLEGADYRILVAPVKHLVPTIGLRMESRPQGKAVAYSCDTEPCPSLVRLAQGASVLLHEATGGSRGHSTAQQAGETAREAGVGRLLLIHYPTGQRYSPAIVDQARQAFSGPVELAEDFMQIDF